MQIINDLAKAQLRLDTVLTVGAFDGVHLGHQALIGKVVKRADETGRLAALVTFHPHPAAVLAPERTRQYLTTPSEKLALLEVLGIDLVALLPFNRQLAASTARDFVARMVHHLRPREVWIGPDFALGRAREGDAACLRLIGQSLGFQVRVLGPVAVDGVDARSPRPSTGGERHDLVIVSSSRLRQLLREGRVVEASELLGRRFSLAGEAVFAAQRNQVHGMPVASLAVPPDRAAPASGVYYVLVGMEAGQLPGVATVSSEPGSAEGWRTLEVYLSGPNPDHRANCIAVEFVDRVRDEWASDNAADLMEEVLGELVAAEQLLAGEFEGQAGRAGGAGQGSQRALPRRFHFEEIEHTADRALRVWGQELSDLFAGAARGMYSLMADVGGQEATRWREIRLEGTDLETLLVDWLNELLFLTESAGLLFLDYGIEIDDCHLVAQVAGYRGTVCGAHIKAATFHDLAVVDGEGGWSTTITFDV